jgi:hypothetical protein
MEVTMQVTRRSILVVLLTALLAMLHGQLAWSAALHDAVTHGDKNAVQRLIDQGVDVNSLDENGFRALHLAAMYGATDIAVMLIDHGSAVDATTATGGLTSLHIAAMLGDAAVVKALLAKGAHPDVKATDGTTALTTAARLGEVRVVLALLAHYNDSTTMASMVTTCVQASLQNAGYGGRSIDGKASPDTAVAVRKFQQDAGLEPDGKASVELLRQIAGTATFDVATGPVTFRTNVFVRHHHLEQEQRWQSPLSTARVQGSEHTFVRIAIVEDTRSALVEEHSAVCLNEGGVLFRVVPLTGEPAKQSVGLVDDVGRNFSGLFRLGNLEIKGCITQTTKGILFAKGTRLSLVGHE